MERPILRIMSMPPLSNFIEERWAMTEAGFRHAFNWQMEGADRQKKVEE
jgi:hypothetical protein